MLLPDLFRIYTAPLNELELAYMITGSIAGMIYGEPRITHDIDLVLRLSLQEAARLEEVFPLEKFYVPPIESLRMEVRRNIRGHFNLIHHETGFRADIYLEGRDPLHLWAMEKRRVIEMAGQKLWVAPPEYVIIRKMEFFMEGGSEKHLTDIAGIIAATTVNDEAITERLSLKAVTKYREIRQADGT